MSSSTTKESVNPDPAEAFAPLLETRVDLNPFLTRWVDKPASMFLYLATLRDEPYNSVKSCIRYQLSTRGRLALPRDIDLIDTFEVDLLGEEEVESATLSACISVPTTVSDRQKYLNDCKLFTKTKSENCTTMWIPIKTLKNPTKQFKFFDKPITPTILDLSIEIKMKKETMTHRNIYMDIYVLTHKSRIQSRHTFDEDLAKVARFVFDKIKLQFETPTKTICDIWQTSQVSGTDLFSLFKYYLKDVRKGDADFYFIVDIPRKAELIEINQFDMDMYRLGLRKTQSYTLFSSTTPFEYEIWGTENKVSVCFTLDSNPFTHSDCKLRTLNLDDTLTTSSDERGGSLFAVIGSGKSTLVKSILEAKKDMFSRGIFVNDNTGFYDGVLTTSDHYNTFYTSIIDSLTQLEKPANDRTCIVLDDWVDVTNCFEPQVRSLFFNGRHWNTTTFVAMQYPIDIPSSIRSSFQGVFIFPYGDKKLTHKKIWEQYGGCVPEFSQFCEILNNLPINAALFIDNRVMTDKWQDCIFQYNVRD